MPGTLPCAPREHRSGAHAEGETWYGPGMSDIGSARKARDQLKAAIGAEPWCAGIGVEREDGIGFIVRVSIRPGTDPAARAKIPDHVGVSFVKVIETD